MSVGFWVLMGLVVLLALYGAYLFIRWLGDLIRRLTGGG